MDGGKREREREDREGEAFEIEPNVGEKAKGFKGVKNWGPVRGFLFNLQFLCISQVFIICK